MCFSLQMITQHYNKTNPNFLGAIAIICHGFYQRLPPLFQMLKTTVNLTRRWYIIFWVQFCFYVVMWSSIMLWNLTFDNKNSIYSEFEGFSTNFYAFYIHKYTQILSHVWSSTSKTWSGWYNIGVCLKRHSFQQTPHQVRLHLDIHDTTIYCQL